VFAKGSDVCGRPVEVPGVVAANGASGAPARPPCGGAAPGAACAGGSPVPPVRPARGAGVVVGRPGVGMSTGRPSASHSINFGNFVISTKPSTNSPAANA